MTEATIVIQLYGEGPTDVGPQSERPVAPAKGVVAILVHKMCGTPSRMAVRTSRYAHLHGKNLAAKVKFAKRQDFYNKVDGVIFVMDSEGDMKVIDELIRGRDAELPDFPMAVGMAHPCIEAWLLCDAKAIQAALSLPNAPELPEKPELLPAPQKNRNLNPKSELERIAGAASSQQKDSIAKTIKNLDILRERCPVGFAPFADEVLQHIKPLFD